MMHIFVALYLKIYVPISLCAFKTKLERQNKWNIMLPTSASAFPIVILDIIILYDSLTDGLKTIRNGKIYAALK